jgi:hypothetical protein
MQPYQSPLFTRTPLAAPTPLFTPLAAPLPNRTTTTTSGALGGSQSLHCDVTFLTMLTRARSYYGNAWAVTVQHVQADILWMHEFFTNEQEAHSRTLGMCDRLNSELQRAWYKHGLANKERERLDAELTRAVDGYDSLKMHIHKLVIEALKSGLGDLVGGSTNGFPSEANATGGIVLYSPDVITKICGSIDTEL